ncbi:hypothetical protein EDD21DRAFT_63923 [Dissophora ornata]|nr:hypothetical protein EDD21DRAFT_63923 [Dissophora ornata]
MEDNNIAYQQSDTLDNVSTTITVTNIGILNGTGESELHPQDSSSKSRVRLSTPRRLLQGIRKARQLFSPKQEQSTAVLGAESVLVAENEELEFGQHSEDIGCDDDDDDQQQQQQLSLFDPMQNIKEPWCEGSCREGQGTEERNRTHPLYTRGGNRPVLIQPAQIRSLFLVMDEIPWSADVERPESDTRQKATTEGGQVRETLELEQTPQEPTLLSITALHRSKSLPSTHFCSKTSILVSSGSDDTNSIQGPAIETFTFTIPAITTVAHALEPTPRPAPVLFDGMTPEELIQSIRFENDREGSHVFYGTREYERDQERKRRLARVGEKKTGQQGQEGLLKRTSKRAGEVMAKAKSLTSLPARILFGANAGMSDGNGSGSGSDGSGGSGQTTGRTGDGPSSMEASSVSDVILETVSGMASTMWTRATTTLMGRISAPSVNREGKGENGKERKGEEEEEEKDLFLPDKDAKAAGMSTAESNCP